MGVWSLELWILGVITSPVGALDPCPRQTTDHGPRPDDSAASMSSCAPAIDTMVPVLSIWDGQLDGQESLILLLLSAVLFAVAFSAYLSWSCKNKRRSKEVDTDDDLLPPGPEPSDPVLGNLGDVGKAGSLHEYLVKLHKSYGGVVSFWWMNDRVVSLGDPAAWRSTLRLAHRPVSLFQGFMSLIGKQSIQYANGAELRRRRTDYVDPAFGHGALKDMFWSFESVAQDLISKWRRETASSPEGKSQVQLHKEMTHCALKAISLSSLGDTFQDEKEITQLAHAYHGCWSEMERRVAGDMPQAGSTRETDFERDLGYMHAKTREILAKVRQEEHKGGSKSFIHALQAGQPEELIVDEIVTFLVGGFHTTGNSLTWALYYLAKHPAVARKCQEEMANILGESPIPTFEDIPKLVFTNQVINETLRCSVLAPWAARYSDEPTEVGDYVVPAGTAMIHALGVVLHDPNIWPEPHRFDPDRFSAARKKTIPRLAFSPFGFAGKRICPGQRFANFEMAVVLSAVLQTFDISLPDGYVAQVTSPRVLSVSHDEARQPVHGLVTSPAEEIPLQLKVRDALEQDGVLI